MKYTKVFDANAMEVRMSVACRTCGARLSGDEKFCPQCGRMLERKPKVLKNENAAEVLSRHILDGETKAEGMTNATATPPANLTAGELIFLSDSFSLITQICEEVLGGDEKYSILQSTIKKFLEIARISRDSQECLKKIGEHTVGFDVDSIQTKEENSCLTETERIRRFKEICKQSEGGLQTFK